MPQIVGHLHARVGEDVVAEGGRALGHGKARDGRRARRQGVDPDSSELEGVKHNVIVRSLGPQEDVQVDVEGPHPIKAGDIFLMCSDGLSGLLSDHEIGASLHLSPHTVKHHVDTLRAEVGARNRIELAAWAGKNGFYELPEPAKHTVPVTLAPVPEA